MILISEMGAQCIICFDKLSEVWIMLIVENVVLKKNSTTKGGQSALHNSILFKTCLNSEPGSSVRQKSNQNPPAPAM